MTRPQRAIRRVEAANGQRPLNSCTGRGLPAFSASRADFSPRRTSSVSNSGIAMSNIAQGVGGMADGARQDGADEHLVVGPGVQQRGIDDHGRVL